MGWKDWLCDNIGICIGGVLGKKPGIVKVTYGETAAYYGRAAYVIERLSGLGPCTWPEDGSYWHTGVYSMEGHLDDADVKLVWSSGSRGIAVISQFNTLWFADVDMNTGRAITIEPCQPVSASNYEQKLAGVISTVSKKQTNVSESRELFDRI